MNAKRARAVLHELLKQRLVSCLLLVAAACLAARQSLLSVHQVFPGGAEIGEVVYDLGIGHIAAWIFNVLVVVLPRLHDRQLIMPGAGKLIKRMCALGLRAVPQLSLEPDKFRDLTDAGQRGQFELQLANIQKADTSSVEVYHGRGDVRPLDWHEWAVDRSIRAANAYQSLVPFFPFFESELVLQPHFVVFDLSSLVVAGFGAVLVASAPAGPGPGSAAAGKCGDQVCQETADLAERDWDEAAARAFGAVAAATAR